MKFHAKKSPKAEGKSTTKESNLLHVQSGSVMSNTSEIPMKPFKGTKYHLEECKHNEKEIKIPKKRKAHSESNGLYIEKEKKTKYDPLQLMSKLEKFSDVWNDCPDVENPKSNFEIVPNDTSESKVYNKANNFEHKNKGARGHETNKWSIPNGSGKAHYREKDCQKVDDNKKCYEVKSEILDTNATSNNVTCKESADVKRKKAIQEKIQLYTDQRNVIKKALSSMGGKQKVNKKIVFSDAEDTEETKTKVISDDKTKGQKLFDDDSSESDLELKVNRQFEGKKGQKLLELQSKFASDSRFTLDSRFHESESENEKDEGPSDNLDIQEEKKRQLEILESIVNQPIRPLSEGKKITNKRYDESLMVRFDPTREDHQKYLLKHQKPPQEKGEFKEKTVKKSKKESKLAPHDQETKPEVSNEKVYAVKEDLKQVLNKENKTEFSLLKLFGSKDEDSNIQQEGSESTKKLKYATKNPFRYDSSQSESEGEESKKEEKKKHTNLVKPSFSSWKTTFFFTANDSRLKEAEEFLKVSEKPEGEEKYAEKRKFLKDFIRHKLKNNNRKQNPFKKKLGGIKNKRSYKKRVK